MSSAHPTRDLALSPTHLSTIRRALLEQTSESLRMAADAFDTLREQKDVTDALGDVPAYTRSVREDLDGLEALGYRDEAS
jgi:hypothetical protein